MADIKPFKGLRFDPEKVDLSAVVTPPYDVISDEQREAYYLSDPHNIVRVILGREQDGDDEQENRYTRSREYLDRWKESGVLLKDREPSLYPYDVTYPGPDGKSLTRRGILARLRLYDFEEGVILPHERTFDAHREDRMRMLHATNANLSPIFVLYEGGRGAIEGLQEAATECHNIPFGKGAEHTLRRVTDEVALSGAVEALKDSRMYIADGHHRYETALNNCRQMATKNPAHKGDEAYNYVLACLTPIDDPGLAVFPTHRLVRNVDPDILSGLSEMLATEFIVEPAGDYSEELFARLMRELEEPGNGRFLLLKGRVLYRLSVPPGADYERLVWKSYPAEYKRLDVTLLHEAIIERLLGKDWYNEEDLVYEKKEDVALERVLSGDYELGFFMKATSVAEMTRIAGLREIMPPKSTYFYPKLLSGIVINEHD